jgi:hypothetical protein
MSGNEKNQQVNNAYGRLLYNQVMFTLFIILRVFHLLIIISYIITCFVLYYICGISAIGN